FLATAFFAHSTDILRKTAKVLGKTEEEKIYGELHQNIKKAFQQEFITDDGRTSPNTQTAYTLALVFDLMPENLKAKAAERLAGDIKRRGTHISTGFLGTPHIAKALSENGQLTMAYELLLQESYPSWLFPVKMGATTIWERWDGQKPDSTFQDKGMNSFNHYAYGAIGSWMYNTLAGITLDPEQPGYKHFFIQPKPDKRISSAKASLLSPYGKIVSDWKISNAKFTISVSVPVNSQATILLPKADLQRVTESGKPLVVGNGILEMKQKGENTEIKVGSGNYQFTF
ncbi:MAG: alpha-L-rhamnosidase, partial [Verrucomicrobia bacterium]|nr:alpha-L-rhamnosidase [Cytophagales bacterium]